MNYFLILTFLFAVGSVTGWCIELIYRRFVSQKHWVNPGFLAGPCLPLYGFSLCILYLILSLFGFGIVSMALIQDELNKVAA